jgi:hypothetical protein
VLDESLEVDLDELARRDQENLALRKMLFRGIECDKSCYLFSKVSFINNIIRISKVTSANYATGRCIMENSRPSL